MPPEPELSRVIANKMDEKMEFEFFDEIQSCILMLSKTIINAKETNALPDIFQERIMEVTCRVERSIEISDNLDDATIVKVIIGMLEINISLRACLSAHKADITISPYLGKKVKQFKAESCKYQVFDLNELGVYFLGARVAADEMRKNPQP